ncbi:hypothetical protein M422DRAFT_246790 [Sphaerobolus stellatus SS14]|nr:hypothetical protein M422DRAFT_246790 [Sphaerobolus stellatus SS14]
MPREDGTITDNILAVELNGTEDDILGNFYEEIAPNFEKEVLQLRTMMIQDELEAIATIQDNNINISCALLGEVVVPHSTATVYSILIGLDQTEIQRFQSNYKNDTHFSGILNALGVEENWENPRYPQYSLSDEGLIFFEDSYGNFRLCIPCRKNPKRPTRHDQAVSDRQIGPT